MTTQTAARPYELRAQTAKTLLQRLYGELTELTTQEAEMARLEVRERAAMTARAGMISATAAAAALVGFASFAACAIAALAYVLPVWLAALIVGAGCLAAGFALSALARREWSAVVEPMRSLAAKLCGPVDRDVSLAQRQARVSAARERVKETLDALERKSDLLAPMRDTALGLGSLGVAMASIVRNESGSP